MKMESYVTLHGMALLSIHVTRVDKINIYVRD